mmetsp:Transcript_32757/g.80388  ORF Transcript_32757/g.80388 Transcript_32757/m.80388 type:complete len:316 (+) Transcript_32757:85-1032(+)
MSAKRGRDQIPDLAGLKRLKVTELKDLCARTGVPKRGNKSEIVEALDAARPPPTQSAPASRQPLHGETDKRAPRSPGAHRSAVPTPQHPAKKSSASALFAQYSESDGQRIGMEGFMRLGLELAGGDADRSVTPEHTALLLFLSWKMGSTAFAVLPKDGFLKGCETLQCFTEADFIAKRGVLMAEVTGPGKADPARRGAQDERFQQFHSFCFDVLRPEGKKYVEKDMAILALQAIFQGLPGQESKHIDRFVRYLQSKEKLESINADQWKGFLQFSRDVDEAFSGYSDEDPWPSMLDDFVGWAKSQEEWVSKFGAKP